MEQKTDPSQEWMDEITEGQVVLPDLMEPEPVKKPKRSKKKNILKRIVKTMFVFILIVLVFGAGMIFDQLLVFRGSQNALEIDNQKFMQKLILLENTVKQLYYYETDNKELEDGMFRGFMAALDDPYAAYYSPDEYKQLTEEDAGQYKGIGVSITKDATTGYAQVMEVFKNNPAYNAGVKVNDYIIKVNHRKTKDMTLTDVVREIKTSDDPVLLDVLRGTENLEISVSKSDITLETVTYEMKENKIGYISISQFIENTDEQFDAAVSDLEAQGMKGLVIDLRDNGGGLLDTCVNMVSRIIPKDKLIVYTEDKKSRRNDFNSNSDDIVNVPIVLLVNGNTASASEILTGCLKDYRLATVVGTKTFGKGIVQSIMPYFDGSAVKMTVSSYFSPSGKCIHKKGIEPDETIEITEEEWAKALEDPSKDVQLKRALEILTEAKSN